MSKIDRLLSVRQIGEVLGFGRTKTYQLIQEGKLHVVRLDRNVRVKESDLLRFIDQNEAKGG